MTYTIAFFGTKPYDEISFDKVNKKFGFEIKYFKGHLNRNNVMLDCHCRIMCIHHSQE